jgi:hypothetical protein
MVRIVLKPTQSGKTSWLIDEMTEDILIHYLDDNTNGEIINMIISHNRNILTTQTYIRIKDRFPDLLELSSKSSQFLDVYIKITTNQCNNIICCGNKIQFNNISKIIEYALQHRKIINIYADEIDYYWHAFKNTIIDVYDEQINIIGLTASINKKMFIDSGGKLDFIHIDYPITENYNRYTDNEIITTELDDKLSLEENYIKWLDYHDFSETDNIFLAGTYKNSSHFYLKDQCFLRGICPITINQFGFNLYLKSATYPIKIEIDIENDIQSILKTIRQDYNITRPIAVIGFNSPGRGVTLQSGEFMFTHAIVLLKCINKCTLYQLLGRLTHNFKYSIRTICKIFVTEKIDKIVKEMEHKAINIHQLNIDSETVTYQTYNRLKPQTDYDVTELFNNKELCKNYLLDNIKDNTRNIPCYQLNNTNLTIKYQDPHNTSRTIDTPIVKFITRDQFKTLNWGFKSIGKANSSPRARVMPVVNTNNEVKWVGLYIKECFNITD